MSNEKHFYLGANTPYGFFSYYDNIVSQQEARRIYCIKGGPGTGKSSFMRKIAEKIMSLGYDVEFIHCSSDDGSLDGIFVKRLKIAFLDGTSPHIADPKNPGAVDKIINLGEFWDEEKMTAEKRGIIDTNAKIGETFARAYKYLAAAKAFYDDMNVINEKSYDLYERNLYVDKIVNDEFSHLCICPVAGRERKLFASAITPTGLKFRPETLFDGYRVKILRGYTGDILNEISLAASVRQGMGEAERKLSINAARLDSLAPARTLERGYAIIKKGKKYASSAGELAAGDNIEILLSDGTARAKVLASGKDKE